MSAKRPVDLNELLPQVMTGIDGLKATYGSWGQHPSTHADPEKVHAVLGELIERLDDNFPYFHPQYAGQMLKPPHPVATAAYLATMQLNPNNHSIDASRATTAMEHEVLDQLAAMFDYPAEYMGHLTWSGTTANLEALWISREIAPGKAIAHSADAHYTHSRMGEVLGIDTVGIPTDAAGRMELEALERELATGRIGVVVATLGTTGLGAVDPLADIIPLARRYGARIHVDTAYGGFFAIIADELAPETARHFRAIKDADSVVVDPHKHGLQPYGCGAVLFNDQSILRYYHHESPYTYFASTERHFGEIQLECSRAGASAAALWATLRVFPLTKEGLGGIVLPGYRAAQQWHALIEESDILQPYQRPEIDIITYLPRVRSMAELDRTSHAIFEMAADTTRPQQTHLATYVVKPEQLRARGIDLEVDAPTGRIMRSVLMKPEHEPLIPEMHHHVSMWSRRAYAATHDGASPASEEAPVG
ncbi:aminotransferase class V-fold PLP-dependent enzyme [Yonghaparkia sp. Root332]|uniref:pyridoxal phosphate-dependent decarboxylase family protein n=1 Tax=Yonghaparkia sp. Root332 TaxID=1736516 RepID=UPI000AA05DDD|nr:aminotransferase class V-fold PLP-dependent enzyme [Yonghaparkia sp. Root332]